MKFRTHYNFFTCRPLASYTPEQFIRAYDIRTGKELPVIPFIPGALVVKFHPRLSSTIFAVSQAGSFQFLDISGTPSDFTVYQVRNVVLAMEIYESLT